MNDQTSALSILAGLGSLGLGLAAIPSYTRYARKKRIVDTPNERSSHTMPTPRGGGIFIAIGALFSLAAACLYFESTLLGWALVAAAGLVAIIGFTDDLKTLPSLIRLGGHFLAAAMLIVSTVFLTTSGSVSNLSPSLLAFALPGLAIWVVGCLNIYNFMDGIDGIATGQGLCAAATWLTIALRSDSPLAAALSAALLGGLLAFLFFNWSPAKVFMGDGASGFLGFCFAAMPLLVAQPTPADLWLKINLGALALFPFLFDGTFTLCRRAHAILIEDGRLKMGRFPRLVELTQAHRSHLYQRWTQSGASHSKVASAYTGWAALGAAAALLVYFQDLPLLLAYGIGLMPAIALLIHSRNFPK